MKKALLVGIDHYSFGPLTGCVNDANDMEKKLEQHYNGEINFSCKKLISGEYDTIVTEGRLRSEIRDFFKNHIGIHHALFYFAGHGFINFDEGYLVTQDSATNEEGVGMHELFNLANTSKIPEIVIILDCCFASRIAESFTPTIRRGLTILASSTPTQPSLEHGGNGKFTQILLEGLEGGAAEITGEITVASLYHYADKLLDPFEQRPVFLTHMSRVVTLRKAKPKIDLLELRKLREYFPSPDFQFVLDPSYEFTVELSKEEKEDPGKVKTKKEKETILQNLQRFTSANLVQPVGEKHMYFAAMNSKSCELTYRGKFYWRQIAKKLI